MRNKVFSLVYLGVKQYIDKIIKNSKIFVIGYLINNYNQEVNIMARYQYLRQINYYKIKQDRDTGLYCVFAPTGQLVFQNKDLKIVEDKCSKSRTYMKQGTSKEKTKSDKDLITDILNKSNYDRTKYRFKVSERDICENLDNRKIEGRYIGIHSMYLVLSKYQQKWQNTRDHWERREMQAPTVYFRLKDGYIDINDGVIVSNMHALNGGKAHDVESLRHYKSIPTDNHWAIEALYRILNKAGVLHNKDLEILIGRCI